MQVEFYFSDSNLPRDKFLTSTISESEDGSIFLYRFVPFFLSIYVDVEYGIFVFVSVASIDVFLIMLPVSFVLLPV